MCEDEYLGPNPAPKFDGWGDPDRKDPDSRLYKPRRPGARKDTRHWCKGKPNREHTPNIEFHPYDSNGRCHTSLSFWHQGRPGGHTWTCYHAVACSTCGKILERFFPTSGTRCPEYPGPAVVAQQATRIRAERQDRLADRT